MKVLILSFFISIPVSVFAAVSINDPSDLLGTIDNYINSYNFDSAFSVGDKAWYSDQDCTFIKDVAGNYSADCKPSVTTLQEVVLKTPIEVIIGNFIITKDQFNQIRGNFLRYYLENSFNALDINSASVQMEKIQFETVNVQGKMVQAIRAFYSINICRMIRGEELCFLLPQEMLLGRNIPAVAQMLEHIYVRIVPVNIPVSKIQDFQRL